MSMLQEVRDSFYLGLLSIFGPGKEGFSFKGLFGEDVKPVKNLNLNFSDKNGVKL